MYNVGPLPSDAHIELLANHRMNAPDGELVRYWIAGDKLLLQRRMPDTLTVWDIFSATVASVSIPRGLPSSFSKVCAHSQQSAVMD